MGGGGGAVAVAVGAAGPAEIQAALADLTRVVPWKCDVKGCSGYQRNGATHKYIAGHREYHRKEAQKQMAEEVRKQAMREKKLRATGPSGQRRKNRLKNLASQQRAAGKAGNKGDGGRGNAARRGGKGESKPNN